MNMWIKIAKEENLNISKDSKKALFEMCKGDLRRLVNIIQSCASISDKIDEKLITLLINNKEIKSKFFSKIKDIYVFNIQDFKFFLDENKIDNSYTKYANKIGLSDGERAFEKQR